LARGKLKVVWFHTKGRTAWAVPHVAERHHVEASNVAVLTLELPRAMLRRNRRGLWTCARVVSPDYIVSVRPPQFAVA
jgi:hypothetical protein